MNPVILFHGMISPLVTQRGECYRNGRDLRGITRGRLS
jgi:hypothetical protein